ncbi:hypothetical protein HNQ86_001354 [Oleiagrimonas soli]|uniref:Uncharacterized protein n=1 Tax=Oleiagrimonas soli TaxID=1543381 RepID=A0A841KJP5_9GAMM|nr:hypothetical protein [Oleiagrimonas soli]
MASVSMWESAWGQPVQSLGLRAAKSVESGL